MGKNLIIWVVSYVDENGKPTVTVFDNEEYATVCAAFFTKSGYKNVELDKTIAYEKFIWDGYDGKGIALTPKQEGCPKGTREYVKVYCCGDCIYYNWKKHSCKLGASDEGKPTDNFFRDCPLGLHEEKEEKRRA